MIARYDTAFRADLYVESGRIRMNDTTSQLEDNYSDMTGKICLVTGANSGIGKATATGLAALGARVVMICRDEERGRRSRQQIQSQTGSETVDLHLADLSVQQEIRDLAERLLNRYERIEVLVNNAGLMTAKRRTTIDGLEMQFAVNHLAPFLLTNLLLHRLRASAPARIITVASTAQSRGHIDFDDLQSERGYNGWQAYANSKLANVLFTYELARRLAGSGVTANCVHPGVIHTGLMRGVSPLLSWLWYLLRGFFKPAREGADTPIYLAASAAVADQSGIYFRYRKPCGTSPESQDLEVQRRLWEKSAALTGARSPGPW